MKHREHWSSEQGRKTAEGGSKLLLSRVGERVLLMEMAAYAKTLRWEGCGTTTRHKREPCVALDKLPTAV